MKRFLLLLWCVGWVAALVHQGASATPAQEQPPNVLFIIGDDQAWWHFSFMDHPHIRTPHLDRLAAQGVLFTRGYVPTSLCRPSLMTMLTGLYPHQHRITGNDPVRGVPREVLLESVRRLPTLPRLLAGRGYRSFQSGKWWEGHWRDGGFSDGMTHGDPRRGGRHGDLGLKIGRQGMEPVLRFMDRCRKEKRPFFVWYAPFLPHRPHTPPKELLDYYRRRTDSIHVARYWAMCEWFDQTCGQLLDYLDRHHLAENTLVVFVVDNGWIQSRGSSRYAPRSKRTPYEGGIRTPVILRWPKRLRPRRDEQTLVSTIDLVPTILAACGVEPPSGLPGVNLLPVCQGAKLSRNTVYGEIFHHDIVAYRRPQASLLYRWVIRGPWKLIEPRATNAPAELYHLGRDPHERHDLAARHPEKVRQLQAALQQWWELPPRCGGDEGSGE